MGRSLDRKQLLLKTYLEWRNGFFASCVFCCKKEIVVSFN
jgi:hypothetical protein